MTAWRLQTDFPRWLAVCVVVGSALLASLITTGSFRPQGVPQRKNGAVSTAEALDAYGKLPLVFEKNLGQTDSPVRFLARTNRYTLFLTDRGAVLRLGAPAGKGVSAQKIQRTPRTRRPDRGESVVCLTMRGAQIPDVQGLDAQPGHANYLIGSDPSRWQRNVPLYGRVKYRGIYPGIDAVYYGNQNRLETDYVVAPGSNPSGIEVGVGGAKTVKFNSQGDLVIANPAGVLVLRHPNVYQQVGGTRREVAANYVQRHDNTIGIDVAAYDHTQPLIIDPVLDYSTYLGGTGGEFLYSVAADSAGNAYVTGSTTAADFPTTPGAYETSLPSGVTSYAFVTKLNPTGTGLVFSTFLGGTASGVGKGVAVDQSGNVYVTGDTSASDFPTTSNAYQQRPVPNGGVFVTELDPTGSTLLYSTYLAGGTGSEDTVGIALAVDPNDSAYNIYVLGRTGDTTFPITATAFQTNNNTNQTNPDKGTNFISRIDPSKVGSASLVYSTFLGGSTAEFPTSIAVDANENAYVTGNTMSTDYPTMNAYLSSQNNKFGDVFVSRLDTTQSGGSSLIYSTYFGGPSNGFGTASDVGGGIAVQPNSIAVVVGYTYALAGQFPTTSNALETASDAPNAIAFLARFDTTKSGTSSLLYSSTWGGSTTDLAFAGTVDATGNIYMAGATHDTDFPVTPGAPLTTSPGAESAFLSEFDPTGTQSLFSTYWGGGTAPGSAAYGVAVDSASPANAYFTGITSNTFPTTANAFQTTFKATGSASDGFVTKMSPGAVTGVFASPGVLNFGSVAENTTSASKTVTLFNDTATALSNIAVTVTGTNASDFTATNNCPVPPATLAASSNCTISVTFTPTTTSSESATLGIADSDSSSPQTVSLTGTGTVPPPGVTLAPSPLNFGGVVQGNTSQQGVILLNNSSSSLTITSISITGTNASDFTQTNNCPSSSSTLASGNTCTIRITFAPTTTGNETATLQVTDSDPSSPQTDVLTGTGTAPAGTVTLAPKSVNFGNVNLNATSAAQTATLTNSKTTALTISSITIAGTNASDFAQSNKCGTSLAANTSCTISITFTPAITATESATLTVSDSDSTSPQTAALSGTGVAAGPDFTISATPSAATVNSRGSVTSTIAVTSVAGFSSPVTLSCSSLPGDATCSFSQNPLTPSANGSATATVTISTSVDVIAGATLPTLPSWPWPSAWTWLFAAAAFAGLGIGRTARRGFRQVACVLTLLAVVGLAGCSGTPSTPTGTYTVSVTGQSASAKHALKFTLTVK